MSENYQNSITDQICKIQTSKKLIALYDRLRCTSYNSYAQLHAKGEFEENPFDFSGSSKEKNHGRRLYTDEELDRARTLLFLSALKLHRLAVLAKKKDFIDGIRGSITANMYDLVSPHFDDVCFGGI